MKGFNPWVSADGTVLRDTPCPYTPEFWEGAITPRAVAIFAALGEEPIGAVVVDMEMYGAHRTFYEGECYCDRCFARYLEKTGKHSTLPPPGDRARTIADTGQIGTYRTLQRERARELAAAFLSAVQRARRGVRLGVLHLDIPAPLQEGEALGFGCNQFPVFCFTEQTYESGFTSSIAEIQERFKTLGADVELVAGLFQSKIPPGDLAEQLYNCARASAGYWVYTMQTFTTPDYQPLPGTPRQYWEAIARADRELDKLADDSAYVSGLTVRPLPTIGPAILWGSFIQYRVLQPVARVAGALPPLWLRRANWVYFWARKGEAIDFELTWRQLGKYGDVALVGLVSPQGEPLVATTARLNEPAVIRLSAPDDGVYGLALGAGMNAVKITRASQPFSVRTSAGGDGAFLTVEVPPLFLPILPGAPRAVLELATPVTAQAVQATVTADDRSLRWSGVVDGVTRVSIANLHGTYLRIDAAKLPNRVLQDFHVKAIEGLVPLAALDATWLLRPAK